MIGLFHYIHAASFPANHPTLFFVVHLVGALGKPTWLLLPYIADFRWLAKRSDSPWYPTLKLFRQPSYLKQTIQ